MVDIKEITKKLESITSLKEKLDYLESLIKDSKDEKLIILVNHLIRTTLQEEESLEGLLSSQDQTPRLNEVIKVIREQEPINQATLPVTKKEDKPIETSTEDHIYMPNAKDNLEIYTNPSQTRTVSDIAIEDLQHIRESPGEVHMQQMTKQYSLDESSGPQKYEVRKDLEKREHKNVSTDPIEMLKEQKKKDEEKVYRREGR